MADTLLDAIVKVSVDPDSPIEEQLTALVQRLQAQFGKIGKTLGETMAAGVAGVSGAGAGAGGGKSKSKSKKIVSEAQGVLDEFEDEIRKFQRDVAVVRIEIRPIGDKDFLNTLATLQDRVTAAQKQVSRKKASSDEKGAAFREVLQANQDLQELQSKAQSLNAESGNADAVDALKKELFAAQQEAKGLKDEMLAVGRAVKKSGDAGLKESFEKARQVSARLADSLRDALKQVDLPGVDAALMGMRSLSPEFKKLEDDAQIRITFDVDRKGLLDVVRDEILKFNRDVALVRVDIRPTGDQDLLNRMAKIQNKVTAATHQVNRRGASRGEKRAAFGVIQQGRQDLQKLRSDAQSLNAKSGTAGAGDTMEQGIFAAKQEAKGLKEEMLAVGRAVKKSGDAGLKESFERARREVEMLARSLHDALSQKDLTGVDAALRGLQSMGPALKKLKSGAKSRLKFDVELDLQDKKFKEELRKVNANIKFQSVMASGSLSGADKGALAALRKEVEMAELAIDKMNSELKKTPELLFRLNAGKTAVLNLKDEMLGVHRRAREAGGSMNNLNNNMYQLGQAVEDFAIGFELNGLQGGIRGAANNISFLVNNMGQALAKSSRISGRMKGVIGLMSGIGAAIGMVVIPRLVAWLENLDEVKLKTQDLSRLIEEAFRKADFDVELDIRFKDFRQSLSETDTLAESIAKIVALQKEASTTKIKLFSDADVFANLRKDLAKSFSEMQQFVDKGTSDLQRRVDIPWETNPAFWRFWSQPWEIAQMHAENLMPLSFKGADFIVQDTQQKMQEWMTADTKKLKELTDVFVVGAAKVQMALLNVSDQARTGVPDPAPYNDMADATGEMLHNMSRLRDVVPDQSKLDGLIKTIERLASDSRGAADAATELARVNKELDTSIATEALAKVSQLNGEYQFQLDVLEKRKSKEEEMVNQLQRQTEEHEKQLGLFEKMQVGQNADPATTKTFIDAARKRLLLEQQIDMLKRINELEEQKEQKDPEDPKDPEKSRRGSPDKFFVGVDARDTDDKQKKQDARDAREAREAASLEKELRLLREAVNKNREQLEGRGEAAGPAENLPPRMRPDDDLFKEEDREAASLEKELRLLREAVNRDRDERKGRVAAAGPAENLPPRMRPDSSSSFNWQVDDDRRHRSVAGRHSNRYRSSALRDRIKDRVDGTPFEQFKRESIRQMRIQRRGKSPEERAARAAEIAEDIRNKRHNARRSRESGADQKSEEREEEINANQLAREQKSRKEREAIAEKSARKKAELDKISADRRAARQAELEKRQRGPDGVAEIPLTREEQDAADTAEIARLQQVRQKIREDREQRKKDEAEAFRRSDEEREKQRAEAMAELRKRAKEREAAEKSEASMGPRSEGQAARDAEREQENERNRQRVREVEAGGERSAAAMSEWMEELPPFTPEMIEQLRDFKERAKKHDDDDPKNLAEDATRIADMTKSMRDGLPFTSETIEKLLVISNRSLEAISQGILKFDTSARVA